MRDTKKTKIVITIGPASAHENIVKDLIKHGVNVFRFNMKHGTFEEHHKNIGMVQRIAHELNQPIGILIDLQGPEIRIQTKDEKEIHLKKDETICIGRKFGSDDIQMRIPHTSVFDALEIGDKFLLDDGFAQLEVVSTDHANLTLVAKMLDDGVIKHSKSLNLFGKDLALPSLIKDDIERLTIADTKKIDYVALSFVRSKKDLDILRKHMKKRNIEAQVVSKVESQAGIDNIDEIIESSDAIMIGRGDLGIETPIEKLAYFQKMIIKKCRTANTPVIVATQMLESMLNNPIPTRAEATDIANAVLDGTDALMLSEETAIGKYPVKAVEAMAKIAKFNEGKASNFAIDMTPTNATELIVEAAELVTEEANTVKIDKIVVMTETGYTAKALSAFRPKLPVIAVTDNPKTVGSLTLSFGIYPIKITMPNGKLIDTQLVTNKLKELDIVKKGDQILMIHGQHWKQPGQTNAIVLIRVA